MRVTHFNSFFLIKYYTDPLRALLTLQRALAWPQQNMMGGFYHHVLERKLKIHHRDNLRTSTFIRGPICAKLTAETDSSLVARGEGGDLENHVVLKRTANW